MNDFDLAIMSREASLVKELIFMTGVARSGTTLLGQLVGSLDGIEYEFEPWLLSQLPVLVSRNHISKEAAKVLLEGYLQELLIYRMLGRQLNARPSDDSRFWLYMSNDELVRRWRDIKNRDDARQEVLDKGIRLAVKVPDMLEFYDFILYAFPMCKIISVVRNGFDVARSMTRKRWFDDAVLQHYEVGGLKCVTQGGSLVPWWVPDDLVSQFLSWQSPTRALFTWRHLVELELKQEKNKTLSMDNFLRIKYEDLVSSPDLVLKRVESFIGRTKRTLCTQAIFDTVDSGRARRQHMDKLAFDIAEYQVALNLMKRLGYPVPVDSGS